MARIGKLFCPQCESNYNGVISGKGSEPEVRVCGGCKSGDLVHKALTYKRNPPGKMRIIDTKDMGNGITMHQLEEVEKPGPNPFMEEYVKRSTHCAACGKTYEEHDEADQITIFISDYRRIFSGKCYEKHTGKKYVDNVFGASVG